MKSGEKRSFIVNLIWKYGEKCSAQIVSFVVSMVLARMLSPEDYGTVAIVFILISIFNVFVDSGMASALIQKKNVDNEDFSSVFFFNLIICIVSYVILFFSAPVLSYFFKNSQLTLIIRVLAITVIISALKNVQQAYVSRNMLFKKFFVATIGGTIISAVVGIIMAYYGFGVWALVAQQLTNTTIDTAVLWLTVRWRPQKIFSIMRIKQLFSFGWKIFLSNMIDTVFANVRQFIIGKRYSPTDLAYYNKGKQFPDTIVLNIIHSIESVLFPSLSKKQNDLSQVKQIVRKAVSVSSYLITPVLVGLASCANTVVEVILTDKWIECVPILQILCIAYVFYPIHTANLNAVIALGRSDIFLKLEVIKKILDVIYICISMHFGVTAMAYGVLISSFINTIINSWPNRKLINYSYFEQIKDILPSILLSVVMGGAVWLVGGLYENILVKLVVQIYTGIAIYLSGSIIFKLSPYKDVIAIVRNFGKKA